MDIKKIAKMRRILDDIDDYDWDDIVDYPYIGIVGT